MTTCISCEYERTGCNGVRENGERVHPAGEHPVRLATRRGLSVSFDGMVDLCAPCFEGHDAAGDLLEISEGVKGDD